MLKSLLAGCAFGALALNAASAAVLYDSNNAGAGGFSTADAHVMQTITLGGADQAYTINSFTVMGIRWNVTGTAQAVFVDFYTGVDTSGTSTDALASATYLGGTGYNLASQAVGSYNYTLPGVNINVPSNTVTIEVTFTNSTGTAFSTALGARYQTAAAPAIGTNNGVAWSDANLDNVFTGGEQFTNTRWSPAQNFNNVRMAIDATAIPEPTTLAVVGLAGLGMISRRRKA